MSFHFPRATKQKSDASMASNDSPPYEPADGFLLDYEDLEENDRLDDAMATDPAIPLVANSRKKQTSTSSTSSLTKKQKKQLEKEARKAAQTAKKPAATTTTAVVTADDITAPNDPPANEGKAAAAVPPVLERRNSNFADTAELDSGDDEGGRLLAHRSDDEEPDYDKDDEDAEFARLKTLTKQALMANLNSVTLRIAEAEEEMSLDAMATMKMMKKNIKDIKVEEDKAKEEERLAFLLASFKKIDKLYSGETRDDVMFLKLAQIFQAEYDARVSIPTKISEYKEMKKKIHEALTYKVQEKAFRETMKLQASVDRTQKAIQMKQRESQKRDFNALDTEVANWQVRKRGAKSPTMKSPLRIE